MSFGRPVALLGLLAIPVLVALLVVGERRREAQGARFGTPALVAASTPRAERPKARCRSPSRSSRSPR